MRRTRDFNKTLPWVLVAVLGATCAVLLVTSRQKPQAGEPESHATAPERARAASPPPAREPSPAEPTDLSPWEEFEAALAAPKDPERRSRLMEAVGKIVAENPAAALTQIEEQLEGEDRQIAIRVALRTWISSDATAAADWVAGTSHDPDFESTLAGFAGDWAAVAPSAAARWVSALPENGANASAAEAVAQEWAEADLRGAYEWSLNYYAATDEGVPFQRALAALTRSDPASALAAIQAVPPDLQYRAHGQLAAAWAEGDVAAAADWASALPDGREKTAAVTSVVNAWSQDSPSAAAEYLVSLENYSGQGSAVAMLINNWAMSDAVKASAWLAGLPGGTMRDEAISGFTYTLAFTDPASAATWGMDIGEPQLRDARVEELLLDWYDRDPSAAKQWIDNNAELPANIRKNVLEP